MGKKGRCGKTTTMQLTFVSSVKHGIEAVVNMCARFLGWTFSPTDFLHLLNLSIDVEFIC